MLKRCPFCDSDMSSFAGMTPDAFALGKGTFAINCECGATGPLEPTMQEAVDAWNTRAPAQAAGMQEVLDFLNKIEGDGYGGMASFEIAREHVRSTLSIQHVLRPHPHKTVFAEQLDIQRTASRGTSDGKTP